MLVLGIESSCDETGAALISDKDGLLADALYSQIDMHRAYGASCPNLRAATTSGAPSHSSTKCS